MICLAVSIQYLCVTEIQTDFCDSAKHLHLAVIHSTTGSIVCDINSRSVINHDAMQSLEN